MRSKGLLALGLTALTLGLLGLLFVAPAVASPPTIDGRGFGPGGMMGGWGGVPGMFGMMGGPVEADAQPIGMERATSAAQGYVARFNDPNLELGEVMEFAANYYAQSVERDTGIRGFEMLIDKYSGAVFPEMGPNMVWNSKYGHMGGMMGRGPFRQGVEGEMPIGPERAQELARQYLAAQGLQGRLDVDESDRFYGYYTLHTLRNGEIEGMLSVNGSTGEVWYHAWHGPFVRER